MVVEKHRVLIIHALRPTSRQTTIDHLLAFRKHLPNADVQYLHFAQPLPKDIAAGIEPDLLIVNYDYLNYRFTPLWPYIKNRHRDIARRSKKVVAIAQDDFWAHRLLDNWCVSWKVDRILTPIENDIEVLYPKSSRKSEFKTVLTGYAPNEATSVRALSDRPIDLGQRVRMMPPHLGEFAQKKASQAVAMAEAARAAGFIVDVSTRAQDGFLGSDWHTFLGKCKFTVGMKGGASIADPYGLLYNKVESRRQLHPNEEFLTHHFRYLRRHDGTHRFSAISPRLFEAAAAGTCQILQPDDYLQTLQAWEHYIPLHSDMANIDEVLLAMSDVERCQKIADRAFGALIRSGRFGYESLVSAATSDLLPRARDFPDGTWTYLSEWLHDSAMLSDSTTQDLHDAAFHLIHERKSVSCRSEVDKIVYGELAKHSALNWFRRMTEASENDRLGQRTPWIPRLVKS